MKNGRSLNVFKMSCCSYVRSNSPEHTYCQLEVTRFPFAPITRIHGILLRQRNTDRGLDTSSEYRCFRFCRLRLLIGSFSANRALFNLLQKTRRASPVWSSAAVCGIYLQQLNFRLEISSVITFLFPKGNPLHHPARRSLPHLIIPFYI
jgi:hypothetical protein